MWPKSWRKTGCDTIDGRNPAPVEVGSLSHYLHGFYTFPGGSLGHLPSTVSPRRPVKWQLRKGLGSRRQSWGPEQQQLSSWKKEGINQKIWVVATQIILMSTPKFGEMIQFDWLKMFQMGGEKPPTTDFLLKKQCTKTISPKMSPLRIPQKRCPWKWFFMGEPRSQWIFVGSLHFSKKKYWETYWLAIGKAWSMKLCLFTQGYFTLRVYDIQKWQMLGLRSRLGLDAWQMSNEISLVDFCVTPKQPHPWWFFAWEKSPWKWFDDLRGK